jgi:membrane-associated progesterone receptor component
MNLFDSLNYISFWIDNSFVFRGCGGYIFIFFVVLIGHKVMNRSTDNINYERANLGEDNEGENEIDRPRNFTAKQLSYFDGGKDEKTGEDKPVYLSVNGTVFDVSDGKNFYGPDGPYEKFSGRECGVALAKMSFDEECLDDLVGCKDLNFGEKDELEGWIEKFTYYRNYPIKGRLIDGKVLNSFASRTLTTNDLLKYTGGDGDKVPEGYAAAPIFIGVGDKVYDASFGGVEFYGPGGGYNRFAGRDISRALAKMSFDATDLESSSLVDLNEKQKKVLEDWIKTFEEKKQYPIVGHLVKSK